MLDAILIGLIAGISYLSTTVGYIQSDRPIVTGLLVGIVLGDVQQGVIIGATLELVYLGSFVIGGAFPPDVCTGGILGAAFAISTGAGVEAALALSLPIATLALLVKQVGYTAVRGVFNTRADAYALKADDKGVARMHVMSSLSYPIIIGTIVAISYYSGGPAVEAVLAMIPGFVNTGFSAATSMIPAVGFAMLVNMVISKKLAPYFFMGFLIYGYLGIPVLGVACIGIIVAILIVLNDDQKVVAVQEDDDNEF